MLKLFNLNFIVIVFLILTDKLTAITINKLSSQHTNNEELFSNRTISYYEPSNFSHIVTQTTNRTATNRLSTNDFVPSTNTGNGTNNKTISPLDTVNNLSFEINRTSLVRKIVTKNYQSAESNENLENININNTIVSPTYNVYNNKDFLSNRNFQNVTLNLADTYENSDISLSSHELFLQTPNKMNESLDIQSNTEIMFVREKHFDPIHKYRHYYSSQNRNQPEYKYEQQNGTQTNVSNEILNMIDMNDINVSQLNKKLLSRRNVRHAQHQQNGGGGGYRATTTIKNNDSKFNLYKELKKLSDNSLRPLNDGNITRKPNILFNKPSLINNVNRDINTLSYGYAYNLQLGIFCSFEVKCDWTWTNNSDFQVTNAEQLRDLNIGPIFDADNNTIGNFLFLQVSQTTREQHVISPKLAAPSGEQCRLEVYLHQTNMNTSVIKIIADDSNKQWIVHEMFGNSNRMWRKYKFKVGRITQEFKLILEIIPHFSPANLAIDNIRLVDCYPEPAKRNMCIPHQFRCASTNVCVNISQVCDINLDCKNGEDELQDCDKIPFGGRCDFEDGWCGWQNDITKQIQWSRSHGSYLNRSRNQMVDHTYHNDSGHYLVVNMAEYIDRAEFAATASINSAIFNPPPTVHSNESSNYFNSCSIRFYYHQYGAHKSGLALMLIEMKPGENVTTEIWWSFADKEDKWHKGIVILPNITYRYYLQFNAKKGLRFLSTVALDDISLSPECFGLNIPASELKGYNYWSPPEFIEPRVKETHKDFINRTYFVFTTCGATGKDGPTPENCTNSYRGTTVDGQVEVVNKKPLKGIQRWIVPETGYYTIIAKGASGGKGSGGMGSSRGAYVKGVIELLKGERLYMLIGQEGRSACVKSLGRPSNNTCQAFWNEDRDLTGIRGVLKAVLRDGGGGGGGGTFIFRIQRKNNKSVFEPLMVASGGGGIGLGQFTDNHMHHGFGITNKKPYNGRTRTTDKKTSGAGGGWLRNPNITFTIHSGHALEDGGTGGLPCYDSSNAAGSGGFGGGGGGCTNGGGGGGYAGGNSWTINTTNGEGGTSFISNQTTELHREVTPGSHTGSGIVIIIPAESEKCGCNYQCIALDEHRAQTTCICPIPNWFLGQDNVTCLLTDIPTDHTILIGVLILVILFLAIGFGILCIMLYNRHQRRKSEISRRKMLSGPELQLNRLRMQSDNNVLLTEYNPNYEFGGQVYTIKDLKDIPRDQLRLVKALGQGAFGEVYQGFYKARQSDTVEMPVAVKTLPEMSTQQAEMDFLMEALIMSKFNHPNIVHFIGVCFDKHPRFIILELLAGGDLKNFLRESRPKPERGSPLTMKDLILIAIDVAKGCKYMEEHRFIHRDIAARNCLLTTKGPGRVVKIADFGMSRDIYRSDYYRKGGKAMLPIKWMPPEAFLDGIFTSKTDVWSFGVLLWEIMSMGFMPYTGCSNRQVMQLVTSGGRLEPPSNCPGTIYGVMTQCWHPNPEQRPTFSVLLERLGYCIQDPDVITSPLPVFTKAPSSERDTTVMRPKNTDGTYLQVPSTADYLVPTPTLTPGTVSTTDESVENLLDEEENDVNDDNWETSFMMSQSKSTQPLLDSTVVVPNSNAPVVENLINIDSPTPITTTSNPTEKTEQKVLNHINHTYNNNIKTSQLFQNKPTNDGKLKSGGISLDATNLLNQTKKPYVNIQPGNDFRAHNGPYTIAPDLLNHKTNKSDILNNDAEISC